METPNVCVLSPTARRQAFVEFVNRDVGKFKNADLMCSFCDRILKTGGEKLSDAEVCACIQYVVLVYVVARYRCLCALVGSVFVVSEFFFSRVARHYCCVGLVVCVALVS